MSSSRMTRKVPGGPAPPEADITRAAALAAKDATGRDVPYGESWNKEEKRWEQRQNEFPTVPFAPDEYDTEANLKRERIAAGHANWVLPYTQQDMDYEKRKRDAAEEAMFDQWIARKYDLEDPAQFHLLQKIDPEYTRRREELVDFKCDLIKKYAKTRLLGAQNKEDLRLEFLVETGQLEMPKGPVWDPVEEAKQAKTVSDIDERGYGILNKKKVGDRYQAGFFSPLKWLDEQPWAPKFDNRQDIRGYPNVSIGGVYTGKGGYMDRDRLSEQYGLPYLKKNGFKEPKLSADVPGRVVLP